MPSPEIVREARAASAVVKAIRDQIEKVRFVCVAGIIIDVMGKNDP